MWVRGRWRSISWLAVIALVMAATAWMGRERFGSATPKRWNVLLITLDTTRADHLGCYGYGHADTPTLDAISARSVRYQRCYSPVPLTLPSHCTLMTGLLPPRHGIHDNGRNALAPSAQTLAEILQADGYATSAFISAFVLDHQFGLDQGFDTYDDDLSRGADGSRFHFAQRNAQLVTDSAVAWWNQADDAPKLMWVHYFDPHAPYDPPGYDPTFALQSGYDAEISFVDHQLKRLIETVQRSERETLVVITADHGESLGEHGELTHGFFSYDATLRVPLLVRFPDGRAAGTTIESPVSLADVVPSLLSWLGLHEATNQNNLDGMILPVELSSSPVDPPRMIYIESHTPANYGWSPMIGIVAGTDKLILSPQPERYDLAADPHEEHNLFAVDDERSQQLVDQMIELYGDVSQDRLSAAEIEISSADAAKLHGLGYVSGGPQTSIVPGATTIETLIQGADAKDKLGVFSRFQDAKALIEAGQTSAAADILIAIVQAEPDIDRFRWSLAVIASQDPQQRSRMVDCLVDAVQNSEQASHDPYTLYNLALGLHQEQRPQEAIEILQRLLKIAPEDADAHRLLAMVRAQMSQRR